MRHSRNSIIGYLVAILFVAANLYSYYRMPESSGLSHGYVHFGWPFNIYEYGGYVTREIIVWTGVVGNVFIALGTYRVVRKFLPNVVRLGRRELGNTGSLSKRG